jgi:transcriptional regulator with XRE-family HTH domain
MSKLSKIIKVSRVAYEPKMTQGTLASLLGVSRQTVANYESGLRVPTIPQLMQIAIILNINLECLNQVKEEYKKKGTL